MADLTVREEIEQALDKMTPEMQQRALDLLRTLARPPGVPGRELLRFSGIISREDAQAMSAAIEDCERVNLDEW
jgi:hypothetical protein